MATAVRAPSRLARWQTINLALLVVGYSGYYVCRSNLSVTLPLVIQELARKGMDANAARVALGSIASLGVLAYAIGKFPSGTLADLFGGRPNFLFGMSGSVAFTLLFASSGALPLFTLAWMGNRLVQSLGWAGAVKIASRWFPFRRYGTVMAIISLSFLFGDAAARQFMGVLLAAGMGWRGVFLTTAGVLASILFACLWLRESPSRLGESEPEQRPDNLFAETTVASRPASLRELLGPFVHSGLFRLACALSLGTTILRETFNLWTPTYFMQATGMAAATAAGSSALFPLFGGVSVILCGWLSDWFGRKGRAGLMLSGLALAGVALVILGSGLVHGSRTWPVILVALIGFLIVGPYSFLAGAVALDFGGKHGSGTASGIIDGVGYLSGVLSGGSMARISVDYGWNGAFRLLAVVAFLASAAAAAFLRHQAQVNE
jgi:OPA family glycerol-3-phosphate transporter-like MFS transporter